MTGRERCRFDIEHASGGWSGRSPGSRSARRSIAVHVKAASDQDAWWRRHGDTLEGWRRAIAEHHRRQPAEQSGRTRPSAFRRWASGLRLHPTVLRLHLECWWLTLKLGLPRHRKRPSGVIDHDDAERPLRAPAVAAPAGVRRLERSGDARHSSPSPRDGRRHRRARRRPRPAHPCRPVARAGVRHRSTFCTITSPCRSGDTPGRSLLPTASRGGAWPAIALVVWLATFLTRRSAVRGLHARLCRVVVVHFVARSSRSPRHVARLTSWVDWLAARTLGAELLKDVVRLEQTDALRAIVGASSALDESAALRLVRLTDLLARLTSGAGAPASDRWRSLAIWHQALMWIDRRAGTAPRAGAVAELFTALAATGRSLLDRLDSVDDAEGDALSSGLRRDLRWLVEYADGCTPARPASPKRAARSGPVSCARSSSGSTISGRSPSTAATRTARRHLTAKAPDDVIEAQGILVSSIGLHAASRVDDVHLAAVVPAGIRGARRSCVTSAALDAKAARVARALTAEAPERDHYRIAADIAERHRERRATAPSLRGAALDEAAGHERIGIDSLHDAAGPDFAPSSSKTARTSFDPSRPSRARRRAEAHRAKAEARSAKADGVSAAASRHGFAIARCRSGCAWTRCSLGGLAAATIVYGVVTATLVLLIGPGDSAGWSARALPDRRLHRERST